MEGIAVMAVIKQKQIDSPRETYLTFHDTGYRGREPTTIEDTSDVTVRYAPKPIFLHPSICIVPLC